MKRILIFILISVVASVVTMADNSDYVIGGATFTAENGTFSDVNLQYRKAIINYGKDTKPALAIYMHGGTSKGDDNTKQMAEKGIDSIANYIVASSLPTVFIVPQCPANKSWGGQMNMVVKALIDYTIRADGIDTDRIYIFGGSMGGTAIWGLLSTYPSLFTAAMSVAGNPSKAEASNVAKTPIYSVMGTADEIMDASLVSEFVDSLNMLGGEAKLDIENGWTHEMTCVQSYTTERLDWMFGHKKNNETRIKNILHPDTTPKFYTIDGKSTDNPTSKGLYIECVGGKNHKIMRK